MTESTPPHRESLTPAQTTTQSNRFWAHPVFHTSQWPMVAVTSGAVVVGASIATGVSWLLGRIMFGALSDAWPNWLVPGPASGDEGWLAPIKVALTVAAGVGAAVALVVAYRKQRLAERAEPRDVAADQRERERSYRDRYASATEQLGSSNSTVRLAGVYALANLADQWLEGRHQCVEVLCSHLRVPWSPEGTVGESTITLQQPSVSGGTRTTTYIATPGELEVRKTILRLIGRHLLPDHLRAADNASWSTIPLDLQGAHLPALDWRNCQIPKIDFIGAEFIGDAKFDNATFAGDVDFVGYSGFEGRASPGGIWFREDAGFNHATFSKTASFNGATFDGGAWFVGATFASESKFNDVKFRGGAGFDGATFTEVAWFDDVAVTGDTGFVMATFQNTARFDNGRFSGDSSFQAKFEGGARFRNTTFTGPSSFRYVMFTGGATFQHATFEREAHFVQADFPGEARFDPTTFKGDAWFVSATFRGNTGFDNASFERRACLPAMLREATKGSHFKVAPEWLGDVPSQISAELPGHPGCPST